MYWVQSSASSIDTVTELRLSGKFTLFERLPAARSLGGGEWDPRERGIVGVFVGLDPRSSIHGERGISI